MIRELQLTLPPNIAFDDEKLEDEALNAAGLLKEEVARIQKHRRSIDARGREVKVNVVMKLYGVEETLPPLISYVKPNTDLSKAKQVLIIGAGPAGLFAALRMLELGIKPIIIERGKNIKDRRRDLAAINKDHIVNPDSNYCFGEGGAGTYSDGKLYTRSDKRGNVRRILEVLVAHGASEDILIDAHPHIGTNKLPKLIEEIRITILQCGGAIHFGERVVDFIITDNKIKGIATATNKEFFGEAILLATGHSARDIFYLLDRKNINIEAKPFALGVRAEHSQQFIDSVQYHCEARGEYLPPSSYAMVAQVPFRGVEKGVFSFCMCPGGIIAPCATEQGEVVVNGWSPSKRNNFWGNSGIVVSVDETDWKPYAHHGALAALEYQKVVEKKACAVAGGTQTAPAQLLSDFVNSKLSNKLLTSSYQPGLQSVVMDEILPLAVAARLKGGFKAFGNKMKGYLSNEAQIVGVESRTSSPVRIPRDKETCEHPQISRLFPCGEGAGYAGGIASAAMDGERCAEMIKKLYC